MPHLLKTATLISLIAAPAFADINPRNVWDIVTANYKAMGLQLEATEISAANTLTLENIKITGTFPFDWGSITITTTNISLIGNDDGTVAIKFPESMPLAVALSLPDDLFITATLDYTQKGHQMIASGDPDKMTIAYSADLTTLELNKIDASEGIEITTSARMTMSGMSGVTTLQTGEMLTVVQNYATDKLGMNWDYAITGKPGGENNLEINDLVGENKLLLPNAGFDLANLAQQFRDGAAIQSSYSTGRHASQATTTLDGKTIMEQDIAGDSTDTTMSVSADGLVLKATGENYVLDIKVNELPFPLRGKSGTFSADVQLPLLRRDTDQDIVYNFSMDGVTIDPEIWTLFDPEEILPRDPVNLTLDLSAKAKLFFDLLDFETMKKVLDQGTKFGEISAANINRLAFSAAGTELTGTAAFTFNNEDLTTFDGMPAPDGGIMLKLSGVNALIDRLVKMGLVDENEVMGMRMGLMLIAVAGEQDDTLVSDIKITPDGQITANGKRIK